ncbi:MAG: hypothetical protein AVO35_11370 [Candidatus Aegiribacteria sp. MLS_C]|nr:MAG: hypothetical protein AVO35_11370 [Candidatus Aegiribacteria sp. MLS_C]
MSPEGNEIWSLNHGGQGNEAAENITDAPGGGFYVSGYTSIRGSGDTGILVLGVEGSGQLH